MASSNAISFRQMLNSSPRALSNVEASNESSTAPTVVTVTGSDSSTALAVTTVTGSESSTAPAVVAVTGSESSTMPAITAVTGSDPSTMLAVAISASVAGPSTASAVAAVTGPSPSTPLTVPAIEDVSPTQSEIIVGIHEVTEKIRFDQEEENATITEPLTWDKFNKTGRKNRKKKGKGEGKETAPPRRRATQRSKENNDENDDASQPPRATRSGKNQGRGYSKCDAFIIQDDDDVDENDEENKHGSKLWDTASITLMLEFILDSLPRFDKKGSSYKPQLWTELRRHMEARGHVRTIKQLQNKVTHMRTLWHQREWLKKQSGFGIDPTTMRITAAENCWEDLKRAHPRTNFAWHRHNDLEPLDICDALFLGKGFAKGLMEECIDEPSIIQQSSLQLRREESSEQSRDQSRRGSDVEDSQSSFSRRKRASSVKESEAKKARLHIERISERMADAMSQPLRLENVVIRRAQDDWLERAMEIYSKDYSWNHFIVERELKREWHQDPRSALDFAAGTKEFRLSIITELASKWNKRRTPPPGFLDDVRFDPSDDDDGDDDEDDIEALRPSDIGRKGKGMVG